MPRGPRILPSEGMFHLIGRGNNRAKLFRHRTDFFRFKQTILRFLPKDLCAIQHYALMSTHFHLLAWVSETHRLASMMKALMVSYQHFYRRRHSYSGHLWHSRFRSIHIANENQWLQCARYIELNPVHAGICRDPGQYRWTSYHFHAFGVCDSLIRIVFPVHGVAKRKRGVRNLAYQELVRAGIDLDYHRLRRLFERERFEGYRAKSSKKTEKGKIVL